QLLNAWSHAGRLRSEAAFAMLGGAAPIEASSGKVVRHRLNRSGDRQLNRALHTIVVSPMAYPADTPPYAPPPHRRGQDSGGDPTMPKALPRPPAVQAPRGTTGPRPKGEDRDHLTAIEASAPGRGPGVTFTRPSARMCRWLAG